eukprot:scaffold25307_cov168-Amphora_coffeaeformis.AAC.11
MVVENITEDAFADDHSQASSSSQVTEDPALKDSKSAKSTTGGTSLSSSDESSKFVKRESRHVFYLRVIVLLILFSASAAISLVVFFVTDAGEMESFESQYYAAADKVTENFHAIATDRLQAAGSLIVAMIAHGQDHTKTWPFVTLSSFQQRASTVKDLSGVLYLGFNPVVRTILDLPCVPPCGIDGQRGVERLVVSTNNRPTVSPILRGFHLPSRQSWSFVIIQLLTPSFDISLDVTIPLKVSREQRLAWENYTNNDPESQWYEESREYQKAIGIDELDNR